MLRWPTARSTPDSFQQTLLSHETTSQMQMMIYGMSGSAFADERSRRRRTVARATAPMSSPQRSSDRAISLHAFKDHAAQQAELMESALRLLWSRATTTGSQSPALCESYPGSGQSLMSARTHRLTPERWAKMVGFVHEFGDAARRALGKTGGHLVALPGA